MRRAEPGREEACCRMESSVRGSGTGFDVGHSGEGESRVTGEMGDP